MKKAYYQQGVILAIFSLILLSQVDSKMAKKAEGEVTIRAARAAEISDNNKQDIKSSGNKLIGVENSLVPINYPDLASIDQSRNCNIVNDYFTIQPVLEKKPAMEVKIKKSKFSTREGLASWYGPGFNGRKMANGDIYDMNDISVAHRTLPFGTKLKITNLTNGKSLIAPVLDRGPYVKNSKGQFTREVDLSSAAADALDTKHSGVVRVKIEPLDI
jgi:rare lipoprotein A (peptidoglycan hydrolase)